ncbi:Hypothetical protein, putative [Bodo saltans]|uniref:Uncharacterized protein n=1 Tax=Bodo saltans TaxID=75058 RepID=A0A0S4J463_BODSA|nr:Hypothetical protein, putative [Bodo saltans]|eukprot:CUG66696.1 Hypothetical protein, putative [Bodo saltans]
MPSSSAASPPRVPTRRLGSASPRISSYVASSTSGSPPSASSSSSTTTISSKPPTGPPAPSSLSVASNHATGDAPPVVTNRFAISSAFMVMKKADDQHTEQRQIEEKRTQHVLSSASNEMIWKNLTLQRRQSFGQTAAMQLDLPEDSDGALKSGQQAVLSPKTPSSSSRPQSSHVRLNSATPTRRRPSADGSPGGWNNCEDASAVAQGVVSDLRTLAAKFAHRVDVQRANLSHLGIEVPSSFTVKPPSTSTAGAMGRRRGPPTTRPQSGRRSLGGEAPISPTSASSPPSVPRAAIRSANHQIVTSLVVPAKLPIASSVTPYLVAYERQGNMDFYTDVSKQSRQELKTHILMIDYLDRAWSSIPKTIPSGEYINIEIFKWMHRLMYDHFCCADANEHVWAQVVVEDWRMYGGVTAATPHPKESTNLATIAKISSPVVVVAGMDEVNHSALHSSSSNSDAVSTATVASSSAPAAAAGNLGNLSIGTSIANSKRAAQAVIMDRTGFDNFLFAFVDVWSQTLDVQEYLALGEETLKVVVMEGAPYSGPLCETEEGLEAYRVAAALQQQQQRAAAVNATDKHHGSGGGRNGAADGNHNSNSNGISVAGGGAPSSSSPEIPWTKDMVVEAAEIRSLQAVAAAQQTSKVVDALATMGKSDLGVTEAKQLQGFIRVVCDIEEREEDELRRLTFWANTFVEDVTKRCWWLLQHEPTTAQNSGGASPLEERDQEGGERGGSPTTTTSTGSPSPSSLSSPVVLATTNEEVDTTTTAIATENKSIAVIIKDIQHLLSTHSTDVAEFSDAEGSERRSIVAAVSRLLEAVATAVAERDGSSEHSHNATDISEVRKKITAHWKVGSNEKRKLRGTLQRALTELKAAFRPALENSNSGGVALSSNSIGGATMDAVATVSVSAEERNLGLVLLRELDEMSRQAVLDAARAQEETTLVEFLSAELAAQRPLTSLMETALGNAQEASKANAKRQVKVGSESWVQQTQSLARVEVGLYHVVDSIHQELQKSVGAIVDSCENTIMSALADDSGERFNRFPMHLTQRLDEGREFVIKTCKEHRDWASVMISNLRLFSNEYFTKICPEEKTALATCRTEEDIRKALLIRDEVGAAQYLANPHSSSSSGASGAQSSRPQSAATGVVHHALLPSSSRRNIELAHRHAMHVAAAEFMKKSPALQVPIATFVRPSWFVISKDRARDTFCATHIFPLLQQRNVAWSCTLLGELTEVVGHVTAALQIMRVEVEATLAEILAEAESLALTALASSTASQGAAAVDGGRRRADRDVWNAAVDRSTIEHIQETIQRLVSIPQSTMTAQHEFFLRKTFEWVERRWSTEAEISAIQNEALGVKKKSELNKLDRVGGSLADVHQELNKMDDVVVDHQLTSVETMRIDEEKHLAWMKERRDMRIQGERQLRIMRVVEGEKLTVEQLDQRVRAVAKEQREAAARAVIARFAPSANKPSTSSANERPSLEVMLNATSSSSAGSTVTTSMARWLLASNVVKRGVDGSIIATFRAHPAVEKRRALYLKSKLSNVDVLVSDCTKRGAAIPDAIRVQLSSKPCVFDALVLPLQSTPSIGGGISIIDLLNDLVWLNPLQYLSLNQCNLTNADVESLSKLLAGHPTVNCIDLRYNAQITDAKPIIRLLDVNRATMLLIAVGHGTGLERSAIREVETSSQLCRRERPALEQHEMMLMASHFSVLKSQRSKDGDGKISHISIAAVATEYKRHQQRQGCRGGASHPIAALQGLVAVFIAESQPAIEAWSEINFLNALFPNWNSDQVQQVLDVFTSPLS